MSAFGDVFLMKNNYTVCKIKKRVMTGQLGAVQRKKDNTTSGS
jgi:hypothetical protein